MPITRINEFKAREDQADTLRALIESFLPMIEGAEGCHSCQLLQGLDDPTQLVILEVWESPEAHQALMKNIPPGVLQQAMTLLAGLPKGTYYRGRE